MKDWVPSRRGGVVSVKKATKTVFIATGPLFSLINIAYKLFFRVHVLTLFPIVMQAGR